MTASFIHTFLLTNDWYTGFLYFLLAYSLYSWWIIGAIHESIWQTQLFNSKLNIYKDNIKSKNKKLPTILLKILLGYNLLNI